MKHKLSRKIIVALGLVIFTIIIIYTIVFNFHYNKYEEKILGEENIKVLHSLETSLNSILKNADDYSKMLIADNIVQSQMAGGDLLFSVSGQSNVIKKIYSIFQFSDYVESIWLIDGKGQKLTVGGSANFHMEDAGRGYDELRKPYGKYEIRTSKSMDDNSISLVRSYNSLDNFESLGVIGVDLRCEFLNQILEDVIDPELEQIVVLDEKDEVLLVRGNISEESEGRYIAAELSEENTEYLHKTVIHGREYMAAGVLAPYSGWKIIRYTQVPPNRDVSEIVRFNIGLIAAIGILILIGAAAISTMLTRPIQDMVQVMEETEHGRFSRITSKPLLDEFQILFKGYNRMVEQIERLIQSTIDKQRRIRQVEMNEMQEQMKPHFLYNTLDSIQALAMMGESQKVCELVEALGKFYRQSVSGGREMLSLEEEFQIVKDYVDIMKIRFEDSFECEIQMEESCKKYLLPKLTIQPLIENSFQHGIRGEERYGIIGLAAYAREENLHIVVRDNGAGVPDEVIRDLNRSEEPKRGKSLGLRGTIERLRLLYGENFTFTISNGAYTEIHLQIGLCKLKEQEDGQTESGTA